jgi:hypothetical protein
LNISRYISPPFEGGVAGPSYNLGYKFQYRPGWLIVYSKSESFLMKVFLISSFTNSGYWNTNLFSNLSIEYLRLPSYYFMIMNQPPRSGDKILYISYNQSSRPPLLQKEGKLFYAVSHSSQKPG